MGYQQEKSPASKDSSVKQNVRNLQMSKSQFIIIEEENAISSSQMSIPAELAAKYQSKSSSRIMGSVPSEGIVNENQTNKVRSFQVSNLKPLLQNKGKAMKFPHTFSGYPLAAQPPQLDVPDYANQSMQLQSQMMHHMLDRFNQSLQNHNCHQQQFGIQSHKYSQLPQQTSQNENAQTMQHQMYNTSNNLNSVHPGMNGRQISVYTNSLQQPIQLQNLPVYKVAQGNISPNPNKAQNLNDQQHLNNQQQTPMNVIIVMQQQKSRVQQNIIKSMQYQNQQQNLQNMRQNHQGIIVVEEFQKNGEYQEEDDKSDADDDEILQYDFDERIERHSSPTTFLQYNQSQQNVGINLINEANIKTRITSKQTAQMPNHSETSSNILSRNPNLMAKNKHSELVGQVKSDKNSISGFLQAPSRNLTKHPNKDGKMYTHYNLEDHFQTSHNQQHQNVYEVHQASQGSQSNQNSIPLMNENIPIQTAGFLSSDSITPNNQQMMLSGNYDQVKQQINPPHRFTIYEEQKLPVASSQNQDIKESINSYNIVNSSCYPLQHKLTFQQRQNSSKNQYLKAGQFEEPMIQATATFQNYQMEQLNEMSPQNMYYSNKLPSNNRHNIMYQNPFEVCSQDQSRISSAQNNNIYVQHSAMNSLPCHNSRSAQPAQNKTDVSGDFRQNLLAIQTQQQNQNQFSHGPNHIQSKEFQGIINGPQNCNGPQADENSNTHQFKAVQGNFLKVHNENNFKNHQSNGVITNGQSPTTHQNISTNFNPMVEGIQYSINRTHSRNDSQNTVNQFQIVKRQVNHHFSKNQLATGNITRPEDVQRKIPSMFIGGNQSQYNQQVLQQQNPQSSMMPNVSRVYTQKSSNQSLQQFQPRFGKYKNLNSGQTNVQQLSNQGDPSIPFQNALSYLVDENSMTPINACQAINSQMRNTLSNPQNLILFRTPNHQRSVAFQNQMFGGPSINEFFTDEEQKKLEEDGSSMSSSVKQARNIQLRGVNNDAQRMTQRLDSIESDGNRYSSFSGQSPMGQKMNNNGIGLANVNGTQKNQFFISMNNFNSGNRLQNNQPNAVQSIALKSPQNQVSSQHFSPQFNIVRADMQPEIFNSGEEPEVPQEMITMNIVRHPAANNQSQTPSQQQLFHQIVGQVQPRLQISPDRNQIFQQNINNYHHQPIQISSSLRSSPQNKINSLFGTNNQMQNSFIQSQFINNQGQPQFQRQNNSLSNQATFKNHTSKRGIHDHEEVKETSNESSSDNLQAEHLSQNIPYYPDYVMGDQEQKQKIMQQIRRIRENIREVKPQMESKYMSKVVQTCPKQIRQEQENDQQEGENQQSRKVIIFDMDETLLHTFEKFQNDTQIDRQIKFKMPQDDEFPAYLKFRPYLFKMLTKLASKFQLVLYSSAGGTYVEAAVKEIEASGNNQGEREPFFDYCFSKENCIPVKIKGASADFYSKDVRILSHIKQQDRDFKDVIIVDNLISNFMLQFQNCIPIKDYNGETEEDIIVLKSLTNYLLSLEKVENVRDKIAQDFYTPLFPICSTEKSKISSGLHSNSADYPLTQNPAINSYAPLLNFARQSLLQNHHQSGLIQQMQINQQQPTIQQSDDYNLIDRSLFPNNTGHAASSQMCVASSQKRNRFNLQS